VIYIWGCREMTSGNLLTFIGLYFANGEVRLPKSLLQKDKIIIENDSANDITEFLRAKSIDFTVDQELTYDDYTVIRVTESGVGIGFTDDRLSSIQLISQV
jgi:hypothetical protein